jgi:hypothetical protein
MGSTGSGSLYRKIISPKFFDRKAIRPKNYLTEHLLTTGHLTESSFYRKSYLAENKIYQKVENGHLTENNLKN